MQYEYSYSFEIFECKGDDPEVMAGMRKLLNSMGKDGWELVHINKEYSWFRRTIK